MAAIREDVYKIKHTDLIEESDSTYASPIFCVTDTNRQLRVFIEFKMVNRDIFNDAIPMHLINKQFEAMEEDSVLSLRSDQGVPPDQSSPQLQANHSLLFPIRPLSMEGPPAGIKTTGAVFH